MGFNLNGICLVIQRCLRRGVEDRGVGPGARCVSNEFYSRFSMTPPRRYSPQANSRAPDLLWWARRFAGFWRGWRRVFVGRVWVVKVCVCTDTRSTVSTNQSTRTHTHFFASTSHTHTNTRTHTHTNTRIHTNRLAYSVCSWASRSLEPKTLLVKYQVTLNERSWIMYAL